MITQILSSMTTSISVQVTCSCKDFSRKTIIFVIQAQAALTYWATQALPQAALKTSLANAWKAAELFQNDNDPHKSKLTVAFPMRWMTLGTYASMRDHQQTALLFLVCEEDR